MQPFHPKLKSPTPFLVAVQHDAPEAVSLFAQQLDSDLRVAVLLAAWHGHLILLKNLLDFYEEKHNGYQDKSLYGEALAEACVHNHWRCVNVLLEHNANASFVYHTPLVEAIKSGSAECATILLQHVDPNQIQNELIKAIVEQGHQSGFQMLLSHIPTLKCSAATTMQYAVEYGKPFMVEAVAERMPKLEAYQETGFIPIVCRAVEKGDDVSLKAFIHCFHEQTLDAAHEKLWDFGQRKRFKRMREDCKSNQRLSEQLSEIVENDHNPRIRKM